MQHSYDSFDRPGGFTRVNLVAPLRHRDFALLWGGQTGSLIGDGVFLVAMAWQVYALSNAPTALSMVGIAMTVPTIVLLLIGGVVTDRFDRRRVLLAADVVRGAAVGLMAVLSLTGTLELWHMFGLVALYGAGTAFFGPAFDAIVPDLLPESELAQANSLDQFMRPICFRLAGPALGGWLVAGLGVGTAFAVDSASFALSAAMVLAMSSRESHASGGHSVAADLRQGFRFVRGNVWLWGTLVSAAVAYFLFLGPVEVLLPYVVKNSLHGSAAALGLVFAAGGLGSVGAALVMSHVGQPRRSITVIYATWTLATLAVAGYGLANSAWQLMFASFAFNALETAGTIVWMTLKQREVPAAMLGRVSSLDWLISIGLLPISFAVTGPVAAAIGAQTALVAAGAAGAAGDGLGAAPAGDVRRPAPRRRRHAAARVRPPGPAAEAQVQGGLNPSATAAVMPLRYPAGVWRRNAGTRRSGHAAYSGTSGCARTDRRSVRDHPHRRRVLARAHGARADASRAPRRPVTGARVRPHLSRQGGAAASPGAVPPRPRWPPSTGRCAPTGGDATMILRDLAVRLDGLAPSDRKAAHAILARPAIRSTRRLPAMAGWPRPPLARLRAERLHPLGQRHRRRCPGCHRHRPRPTASPITSTRPWPPPRTCGTRRSTRWATGRRCRTRRRPTTAQTAGSTSTSATWGRSSCTATARATIPA